MSIYIYVYKIYYQIFQFHPYNFVVGNAGSGKTGDIKFTTVGHSSGDTYTIILYLKKEF